MKRTVLIGMSGGIDSAVAAYLLGTKGFHVEGLYIDNGYSIRAETEAESVCKRLGIDLHKVDAAAAFKKNVVDYFVSEYLSGKTPNPCAVCNQKIKFKYLIEQADSRGIDYIATGHYCRVEHDRNTGSYILKQGYDNRKDQSYFLFRLGQKELARTVFPNGDLTKKNIREIAAKEKILFEEKNESQEICFIPSGNYRHFIESNCTDPSVLAPGDIITHKGEIVGQHHGIHSVTIGQRKGLKIASERPYFVTAIDKNLNRVIVGRDEDQFSDGLTAIDVSWIHQEPEKSEQLTAVTRIRYRHRGVPSIIETFSHDRRRVAVRFNSPQKAVAPGQAAVFYEGDAILGGGWIDAVFRHV
ncbi:MAG: tRNA 2-thiouridine(34) synthase MnmA [Syntrophales bacterium]|jgi:tRNA-specific 2-thiouridylase|nr:tRNA 2-thiouridine(34) synthase MnmA [Syntrophales bacterium]